MGSEEGVSVILFLFHISVFLHNIDQWAEGFAFGIWVWDWENRESGMGIRNQEWEVILLICFL